MSNELWRKVAFLKSDISNYPSAPFNPSELYPEFVGKDIITQTDSGNNVYDAVRQILIDLKLDEKNIGTKQWNPFVGIVKHNDNVVVKPNLVFHTHPLGDVGVLSMVAHASIIRPIIDYVLLAVKKCNIVICDVPLQETDFDVVTEKNGLKDLVRYYDNKDIDIPLIDLRLEVSRKDDDGVIIERIRKQRDPQGYVAVDLKNRSEFIPITKFHKKLQITDYKSGTVPMHHNPEKNEYLVSKTILNADVFINVPKLKTHRKAGITVAMKNLVGVNGDKSWIAHHRKGGKSGGGDEYDRFNLFYYMVWHLNALLQRYKTTEYIARLAVKTYRFIFFRGKTIKQMKMNPDSGKIMEGNWYGNDTLWRSIVDLNNIILFADKNGKIHDVPQRWHLIIVDGIVAGEKEGPMEQLPKNAGVLIGGFNAVAVDYVSSHIMGFDYEKIPTIKEGFKNRYFDLCPFTKEQIEVSYVDWKNINLKFEPNIGWKGHIER